MSTGEPSKDEAARVLQTVREQRIRLVTSEVAPRWLLAVLLTTAAAAVVGIGLARDLLTGPAATAAVAGGLALVGLVVAVLSARGRWARRLGFRAALTPALPERVVVVGGAVLLVVVGFRIIANSVVPALGTSTPHTAEMGLLVLYTAAIAPLWRAAARFILRRWSR